MANFFKYSKNDDLSSYIYFLYCLCLNKKFIMPNMKKAYIIVSIIANKINSIVSHTRSSLLSLIY